MYVFYDVEATGPTTAFDQILQFAAIRTDESLREIDRFEIRCRRQAHVVPSPSALRLTGISPSLLSDPTLPCHYEAVAAIARRLDHWTPSILLGWNSFAFDEPLMRQAFFQTLHHPFITTSRGNGRGCVMRTVQAATVFAPDRVSAPLDHRGQPTFRLDRVAPALGCGPGNVHDAMNDAQTTLCVAKVLRDAVPDVWHTMMQWTGKRRVTAFLRDEEAVALTDWTYGRAVNRLVTLCGVNPVDPVDIAVFDLAYDPASYLQRSVDEIVRLLNRRPRVIRALRATSQPILMPASVAPADVAALSLPSEERTRRARQIRSDHAFHERVGLALQLRREGLAPTATAPVEHRLYERRSLPDDQHLMNSFHASAWEERSRIALSFTDPRLRDLAIRLVHGQRPDLLCDETRDSLDQWVAERILSEDPDVPWRTVAVALRETEDLLTDASAGHRTFLLEVQSFLETLLDRQARQPLV